METKGSSPSSSHGLTENSPLLPLKDQDVEVADDGYHQASFTSAVFNLSTTVVGAGIMALPATMVVLGLPVGLLMIIFVGFLTDLSLQFLTRYSKPCKARSYGGLMADSFGTPGRTLTQLCVVVNNLGCMIVYMIIMCDVLSGTAEHTGILMEWAGGATWWNGRVVVLFITTVVILAPLCCLRHVDSLKHSSVVSMALAGVFLFVAMVVCVTRLVEGKIDPPRLIPDVYDEQSFWRLFTVVPVLVTAFICHHNVHPIANELRPDVKMQDVSRASMILCSVIYISTAVFGYLLFGENTSSDILSNFDVDLEVPYSKVLGAIVRISYALHIMLVFPLLNYSLRVNLDSFLFPRAPPLAEDTKRFVLLTVLIIGFAFLGSTLVPNIWVAFEFTGATASVSLAFIFPGAIALRDYAGVASQKDKWLAGIMVVLAVVSSVSAITTNLVDMISAEHS
ncbi:unnamed protein product [Calypogeia fissa]